MKTEYFEPLQEGNPHRLTFNQHIFPKKSIDRFLNHKGCVDIQSIKINKRFKANSNNKLFCAKRAWDQIMENGYMKNIEDDFQCVANEIVAGNILFIDKDMKKVINSFLALWNTRYYFSQNPILDFKPMPSFDNPMHIIGTLRDFSTDDLEFFEKNGIVGTKSGVIPGRHLTSMSIMKVHGERNQEFERCLNWGIYISQEDEFLVPDNTEIPYIPLSPNICLYGEADSNEVMLVNKQTVHHFNWIAIQASKNHYFARNFSKCPGYQTYLE